MEDIYLHVKTYEILAKLVKSLNETRITIARFSPVPYFFHKTLFWVLLAMVQNVQVKTFLSLLLATFSRLSHLDTFSFSSDAKSSPAWSLWVT